MACISLANGVNVTFLRHVIQETTLHGHEFGQRLVHTYVANAVSMVEGWESLPELGPTTLHFHSRLGPARVCMLSVVLCSQDAVVTTPPEASGEEG